MSVGSTSSSSSSANAALVVNGIISGISTQAVIQALLQGYQAPITNLQDEQTTLNNEAGDYQTLNSDFQAVMNAAQSLNYPNSWNLMTASSSNSSVATASAGSGAQTGSLSFTVSQLATSNLLLSQNSVASTNASVTNATSALIAVGGEALGFAGLSSTSLTLGSHSISVTQASQAASISGSAPPASETTITTGQNDTVDVSVNGSPYSLTIPAGTYTASGLASAITSAAQSGSIPLSASVNDDGDIELSSNEQGSDATLSLSGGDALSALGMTSGSSATGADAIVNVDGTSTTLSAINPGGTVTLNAPTGSITATVASTPTSAGSLIGTGSATAAEISTGSGSLSAVVNAINAAGVGATASEVRQADGTYRLQVAASATGLGGAVTVDSNLVAGGSLGSLSTVTAAQNATVQVGTDGGYTLESSSNTFSDLMPGTAITVSALGSTTVTVSPNASGEAAQIQTLVSATNQAVGDLQTLAGYNETTKTGGALMGSAVLENIQNELGSIFATAAGTSSLGNTANVGLTLNSDGTVSFSASTFESAFNANPTEVAALFTQDGSFTPSPSAPSGQAQLVFAGNQTATGSYDVSISQSATQASDVGDALSGGTIGTPETLTIASGGASATYTTNSGESLDAVAAGLNSVFSTQGLSLGAEVVNGDQLSITTNGYGSAANFTVTSTASGAGTTGLGGASAGVAASFAGIDVAGTINGVTATGSGQVLSAPESDPTLNGLSITVPTSGITSPTDLGTFTYSPGLAQQLVTLADSASNVQTGSLTQAAKGLTTESTGLDSQISMYQSFEASQQSVLENEFTKMEEALGTLKNEGSELSSEINQLS